MNNNGNGHRSTTPPPVFQQPVNEIPRQRPPESDNIIGKIKHTPQVIPLDKYNATLFLSAPFTCEYEGKRYRSHDKFNSGPNGCLQCICIDGNVNCNDQACQPPVVTARGNGNQLPFVPPSQPDQRAAASTEPPVQVPNPPRPSSEKGPPSPPTDLRYYASQLTDVSGSDKGPSGVSYMPEQYQYLQAQTGPVGPRGPPVCIDLVISS